MFPCPQFVFVPLIYEDDRYHYTSAGYREVARREAVDCFRYQHPEVIMLLDCVGPEPGMED